MQIREATIHQLIKAAQTVGIGSVVEHVRPEPLPLDDLLQSLCVELSLYATSDNSNGSVASSPASAASAASAASTAPAASSPLSLAIQDMKAASASASQRKP